MDVGWRDLVGIGVVQRRGISVAVGAVECRWAQTTTDCASAGVSAWAMEADWRSVRESDVEHSDD